MWVEPWGKVHCSGLENCVCYHANTGSTVCSISHVVSIDYLRLIALNLAMTKITVGFTSCSITPKYSSLYKSSYCCSLIFYLVLIL